MEREKESFIVSTYRFADSIMRYLKGGPAKRLPYKPQVSDVDRTCIILDKGMGDFILGSFYIEKMIENYSKTGEVYIIADEYNYEFYKAYITNPAAKVIVLKANDIVIQQDNSARQLSKTTQQDNSLVNYRGFFRRAIIPMAAVTPRSAEIVRVLSPVEIYSEGSSLFTRKYSIRDYKLFGAVKNLVSKREFYCKMHREFCKKLFGEDYGLNILEPIPTERLIPQKYFLVNMGASNKTKLLSVSKFLETARELMKRTGLIPVVIGDMTSEELNDNDVIGLNLDYLNRHDMTEAISLCQYSEFVVTSDTGIYHLALSVPNGPKVILPTWSKVNILFEPYPEEMKAYYERLKYIRMFKSCDECPEKGLKCLYKERLRKRTVYCVANLTTQRITDEIISFIGN